MLYLLFGAPVRRKRHSESKIHHKVKYFVKYVTIVQHLTEVGVLRHAESRLATIRQLQ